MTQNLKKKICTFFVDYALILFSFKKVKFDMLCLKSSVFLNVLQSIFIFLEHFHALPAARVPKNLGHIRPLNSIFAYKNITQQIAKKMCLCIPLFFFSFLRYLSYNFETFCAFFQKKYISILDNGPKYLVGCIMQKRSNSPMTSKV